MRLFFFALLTFASTAYLNAATRTATSPSFEAVSSAISLAAAGDTIVIPAGDSTWASNLTISKQIHIQGAGIGKTVIRRSGASLLVWAANVSASVDGIEFRLTHSSNSADVLYLRGRDNKISNCKFVGETSKVCGVRAVGGTNIPHPTGVVWNCTFFSARALIQGDIASSDTQGFGRRIWANLDETLRFGSGNTFFFEDCTFDLSTNTGNIVDAEYGAHYVFRYNTAINGGAFVHGITSNNERGTRLVEIYNNNFSSVPLKEPQDPAIRIRGGTAVVFNNTVTGNWRSPMMLDGELQRYGDDTGDGNAAVQNGTGSHTGSSGVATLTDLTKSWTPGAFVGWTIYNLTTGSRGKITGNTSTTVSAALSNGTRTTWQLGDLFKVTNGYPLRDQVGRGTDSSFWQTGTIGPSQKHEPVYEWNNSFNGNNADFTVPAPYPTWIQAGRDYFDDTQLAGYTPYTYPHPLRSGTISPLSPPSNARVTQN